MGAGRVSSGGTPGRENGVKLRVVWVSDRRPAAVGSACGRGGRTFRALRPRRDGPRADTFYPRISG
jgi:hypothetical protein